MVLFYAIFVAGVNFHSHAAKDSTGTDCSICQASHAPLVQTLVMHCSAEFAVSGSTNLLISAFVPEDLSGSPLDRSPPLS